MPLKPTSRGRERRPTERENYRVEQEKCFTQRQDKKVERVERRAKKALRVTYEANPDNFEAEPEALHSEADDKEDTMFASQVVKSRLTSKPSLSRSGSSSSASHSVDRNVQRKLIYSANKLPPTIPAAAIRARSEGESDTEHISDDVNQISATKRLLHSTNQIPPGMWPSATHHRVTRPSETNRDQASDGDRYNEVAQMYVDDEGSGNDEQASEPISEPRASWKRHRSEENESEGESRDMVNVHMPKMQRTESNRIKASDFDHVTRDVLMLAISVFRCLVTTRAPFPQNETVEMDLAKEAWSEGTRIAAVNVQLTPPLVKLITQRTWHVRGELKTKVHSLVGPFYGFCSALSPNIVKCNRDLAEKLKDGSRFVYEDMEKKRGIYKTDILQLGINAMWFAGRKDEGVVYHRYFNPLPTNTMALVLTAIKCCIDEWATGIKTDIPFTASAYTDVFQAHLASLKAFERHTSQYRLLARIQKTLHDEGRCSAGVDMLELEKPKAKIQETEFDNAILEYEMELRNTQLVDRQGTELEGEKDKDSDREA